jgi:BirA family biotin operon repressor/biotin-[acetyl-CoA-carboxylase] ligase
VTQLDVRLKWPNDVTVDTGKVGGILAQRNAGVTVVGCGLNLWWPEPPIGACGLLEHDPGPSVGLHVSQRWADSIVAGAQPWDRDVYKAACATLGEEVTWLPAGKGRAVDVDNDGALVVDTGRGLLSLRSGEVHTVRTV